MPRTHPALHPPPAHTTENHPALNVSSTKMGEGWSAQIVLTEETPTLQFTLPSPQNACLWPHTPPSSPSISLVNVFQKSPSLQSFSTTISKHYFRKGLVSTWQLKGKRMRDVGVPHGSFHQLTPPRHLLSTDGRHVLSSGVVRRKTFSSGPDVD